MKFQISVQEVMFLVFAVGLVLAGLSVGSWLASLVVVLIFIATTSLAIVLFVGYGQRRAFAIGFLIPMLFYIVPHAYVGSSELDPYGKLPTSNLWKPVFEQLVRREYVNSFTGQLVADYNPAANQGLGGGGFAGGAPVSVRESPDRSKFMMLAHAFFAAALAYCGGKFAVWVNCQGPKTSNEQSHALEPAAGPDSNGEASPPAQ